MVLQLDSWGPLIFLKLVLPPLQYPDQMPATRTKHFLFQQLRYLPMLRLILKTSVRLPTFHFHITVMQDQIKKHRNGKNLRSCVFYLTLTNIVYHSLCEHLIINPCGGRFVSAIWICTKKRPEAVMIMKLGVE